MNPINPLQMLMQNPMQMIMQRGFKIPPNISASNPNSIIQYLLNTGQVSQEQYNNAVNMARQFRC